jgi:hypothetical protein
MIHRILMAQYDKGAGLAGSLMGQQVLGALIATLPRAESPIPIFLDFRGVQTATASFMRACVLGLRDHAREHRPNLYPVVANLGDVVVEELEVILDARGDAMAMCRLDSRGNVTDARVVGQLEPRQRETLEAVKRAGETDATSLHKQFGAAAGVNSPTGWNNRLSALVGKGLLIEKASGRSKSYYCVLPELAYGY